MKRFSIPISQKARPKKVIDVHAHVGMSKVYQWLGCRELGAVMERARKAGIDWCIISHLDGLYQPENKGLKANLELLRAVEREPDAFMWWFMTRAVKTTCALCVSTRSIQKLLD
jgi:hypothetical protein